MITPKHGECIRIVSFNVCSIKNVLEFKPWNENKTFEHMFALLDADIVCFQETKVPLRDLTKDLAMVDGYDAYFVSPIAKRGYSGVAIYVKKTTRLGVRFAENGITGCLPSVDSPDTLIRDLPSDQHIGGYPDADTIDLKQGREIDAEGRAIVLDLDVFVIIGLYCPANSTGDKHDFRESFFEALNLRVRYLTERLRRKVIVLGDLNVTRELYDSADGMRTMSSLPHQKTAKNKAVLRQALQTVSKFEATYASECMDWKSASRPRVIVNQWVADGLMRDTTRDCHPDRMAMYTCWNVKIDARPANFGSRLDYILASPSIGVCHGNILPQLLGSDHCPVYADVYADATQSHAVPTPPKLCAKYLPQFCGRQPTISSFFSKSAPREPARLGQATTTEDDSTAAVASEKRQQLAQPKSSPLHSFLTPSSTQPSSKTAPSPIPSKRTLPASNAKKRAILTDATRVPTNISKKQKSVLSLFSSRSPALASLDPTGNCTSDAPTTPVQPDPPNPLASTSVHDPRSPDECNSIPTPDLIITRETLREAASPQAPIAVDSRNQWQEILKDRTPHCHHGEKCKLLKTKKSGANKGRDFWACARPTGHDSGEPTSSAVGRYRCNFFQWAR